MLNSAARIYPFLFEPYLLRGIIRLRQKMPEKALVEFDAAREREINSPRILYFRGKAYRQLQRYQKALQSYHRALKINPEFAPAYLELGSLLAIYQKYELAEKAFLQAQKFDSSDHSASTNLGNVYRLTGQPEKARRQYLRSLEIQDNFKARYNLAFLFLNEINQPQKALPHLKKALQMTDDSTLREKITNALSRISAD